MSKWFEICEKNNKRPSYVRADNVADAKLSFVKKKAKDSYHIYDENLIESVKVSKKVNYDEVIKKLPRAKYTIDVPWDYIEDNLERYAKAYGLELEPDFQRAHVWTEEQQVAYVEYAMKGGKSGKEIFFNAVGWQGRGDVKNMVLVDGLQRLTAVRKFMRDELKVFGEYVASDFQYLSMSECGLKFSINDLETRKEVLQWYIDFNAGGTQHTDDEIAKVKKLLESEK